MNEARMRSPIPLKNVALGALTRTATKRPSAFPNMSDDGGKPAQARFSFSAPVDDAIPRPGSTAPPRPATSNPPRVESSRRPGALVTDSRTRFEAILRNTAPDELVAAAKLTRSEFLAIYDSPLLLLRLLEVDNTLEAGLRVTAIRDDTTRTLVPSPLLADEASYLQGRNLTVDGAPVVSTDAALVSLLVRSKHFVVPVCKRITAEATDSRRVFVGRAPNKDIVLRHETVSKDHCWFEINGKGEVFVTDAGSKNPTHVNETTVGARATPVHEGDTVRIGALEATLCSPGALWTVLTYAAKRAQ